MFDDWEIINPKILTKPNFGRSGWYPYYAGFSYTFVHKLLSSSGLPNGSKILDPWNGSGTTVATALELGYCAYGIDLNPIMAVAAKARLLHVYDLPQIYSTFQTLLSDFSRIKLTDNLDNDPLSAWFDLDTLKNIRLIVIILKNLSNYNDFDDINNYINNMPVFIAFIYIGLFRAVRFLVSKFIPTNPTWIKKAKNNNEKLHYNKEYIIYIFNKYIFEMISVIDWQSLEYITFENNNNIIIGSSEYISIDDEYIDMVISSPPYCTRIDYAIATLPELSVLGYENVNYFGNLRRSLIGTPMINDIEISPQQNWGETCNDLLHKIYNHNSKASMTYYHKSHLQYFNSIYRSLSEIGRVIKNNKYCILVLQESYYKNLKIDLPLIITEMFTGLELNLIKRVDFYQSKSMADINPSIKQYRYPKGTTESVLCFIKQKREITDGE